MEHIIVSGDALKRKNLQDIIDAKQRDEQDMAEELLVKFEKNSTFMGYVRALVANAMDDVRWLVVNGKAEEAFKKALMKDAISYEWVMKKYNIKDRKVNTDKEQAAELVKDSTDFYKFLSNDANIFDLDPSQCADLIRFYGEFIEAAGEAFKSHNEAIVQFTKSVHEVAASLVNRSKDYQFQEGYEGGKGPQWQKPKTKFDPGQRGRIFGNIGMKDDKWTNNFDAYDLKEPQPGPPGDKDYAKALENYKWMKGLVDEFIKRRTQTELRIARMRGGASLFVQTNVDRMAKIDKVFGLSHGATISGTTTDNIFFFNRFSLVDRYLGEDTTAMNGALDKFLLQNYFHAGGPKGVGYGASPTPKIPVYKRSTIIDPILYILPLGAIVGKGHHSTIECALPLVLNGIIRYTIGDYTTLFPAGRENRNACGDMSEIAAVLSKYQDKNRDRRILIYYDSQGNHEGYFWFDPVKDQQWGAIAEVSQGMSDKFSIFQQFPTKNEVASLHGSIKEALEGLGTQAQRDKFKNVRDFWKRQSERKVA